MDYQPTTMTDNHKR